MPGTKDRRKRFRLHAFVAGFVAQGRNPQPCANSLVGERNNDFARLYFDAFGVFLRHRFPGGFVFAQNVGGLLIKIAAKLLVQIGDDGLQNALHFFRLNGGVDDFHLLKIDGAFFFIKGRQGF